MKKAILIALVIIFAGVVCIPFASGLIMEKTIRRTFADVNAFYADAGVDYLLEIIDYDRGYLKSEIKWKADVGSLKAIYPIEDVIFKDTAKHGFFRVVSTTSLRENPWYETFVAEKLQGRDPLHIETRYGLLGCIRSTIAVEPFSMLVEDETLDVQPGKLVMSTDRKLEHFTSSGNWQGLSAGETLSIGNISLESAATRFTEFIWNGDLSFTMRDVDIREKQKAFRMKEMKGNYLLGLSDNDSKINIGAQFSLDGIEADQQTIDNASAHLAVNGLDADGYEAFMRMYSQNMSQVMGSIALSQKDTKESRDAVKKQMTAMGFQMMAAYEKLLKQGLEFKISDLLVNLDDGQIKGDFTVRLLKDMTFMQFAPIVNQPDLLFDIFYLKTDLSLPAHLVGENQKLVTPLFPGMQTGLFLQDGSNLVHNAEAIDGKLIINGREVFLSQQQM